MWDPRNNKTKKNQKKKRHLIVGFSLFIISARNLQAMTVDVVVAVIAIIITIIIIEIVLASSQR